MLHNVWYVKLRAWRANEEDRLIATPSKLSHVTERV
jgi:hypothetical protein